MSSADYIIVDEAQDFSKEDIELFRSKAKKHYCCMVIRLNNFILLLKISKLFQWRIYSILLSSCRTACVQSSITQKIARLAQYLNSESDELEERCTEEGVEKPKIIKYNNITEQYDAIISLIQNKNMEDVGILFRHNDEVERAYEYFKNHGVNVEAKYGQFMDLDFLQTIQR